MRIDRLELQNFRKFAEAKFDFPRTANAPLGAGSFHVLIGENGTGKTTVLDALAVALGVWLEWKPDSLLANSHRRLKKEDKRQIGMPQGDRTQFQRVQETMSVCAIGAILDREQFAWSQSLPSLREDELINLQGQTVPQLGNLSVEQIANGLMGVDRPDVGQRYEEMVAAAKDYLVTLDEAAQAPSDKLAEFENKLADRIAP